MHSFLRDADGGDGAALAGHFLAGPARRWEVYQHFDPPNGSEGALRTQPQFAAFVSELHARGEVWIYVSLTPPTGTAGLPDTAVYGVSLTIRKGGSTRPGGAKVVIDCRTGLISRMVGPASA